MCGVTCARTALFLFSAIFLLIGGALFGCSLYAQLHKYIHDKHFLWQAEEEAVQNGASKELISRVELYFLIVVSVAIGLGFLLFNAGINGLYGACKNFQSTNMYGQRRSTVGCFTICITLIFLVIGLSAGWLLFVGNDGRQIIKSGLEPTKKPDHKINWKLFDLQETADRILNDITDFYMLSGHADNRKEAENQIRNVLYLSGGVLVALFVLMLLWLCIGCCVSCHVPYIEEYQYVSPERKCDDWIQRDTNFKNF